MITLKLQIKQQTYISYKIHQERIAAFSKKNKKTKNKYTILGISISRIIPLIKNKWLINIIKNKIK